MNRDLQRIGWTRSALIVALFALLAFGGLNASGADLRPSPRADVTILPAATPRPSASTAPSPVPTRKRKPSARTHAKPTPRTHLCRRADGKRYRVDAEIACLKIKQPSTTLLARLRHRKPAVPQVTQPATPTAPTTPTPDAAKHTSTQPETAPQGR